MLVGGRGVLGCYSAAELLGASCGPADGPAEVVVPRRMRSRPGLVVREERLPPFEIVCVDGIAVTSPLRTAFDLGRRAPLVEAVVPLDALAHVFGFEPRNVITLGYRHLGARGTAQLPQVVRLSRPLADSPMETRIRLAIIDAGLPEPVLQHPVGPYRLDMAYPALHLGIEYDGKDHRTQERAMRDLAREAYLSRAGWEILRFHAFDVLNRAQTIAAHVCSKITANRT